MNKVFSKKFCKIQVLNSMLESLNNSDNQKNSLIVHTSNGLYIGKLRNFDNSEDFDIKDNDDTLTCYRKLYLSSLNDYKNSYSSTNIEIPEENPLTIELEDVSIITGMKTITLPFVSIFIDQIIAVSFGKIP